MFSGQLETPNDEPLNSDWNMWKAQINLAFRADQSFGWKEEFTDHLGEDEINIRASPIGITYRIDGFALNQENGLAIARQDVQQVSESSVFCVNISDKNSNQTNTKIIYRI